MISPSCMPKPGFNLQPHSIFQWLQAGGFKYTMDKTALAHPFSDTPLVGDIAFKQLSGIRAIQLLIWHSVVTFVIHQKVCSDDARAFSHGA